MDTTSLSTASQPTCCSAVANPSLRTTRSMRDIVPGATGQEGDRFSSTQSQNWTSNPTASLSEIPSRSANSMTSGLLGRPCSILIQSAAIPLSPCDAIHHPAAQRATVQAPSSPKQPQNTNQPNTMPAAAAHGSGRWRRYTGCCADGSKRLIRFTGATIVRSLPSRVAPASRSAATAGRMQCRRPRPPQTPCGSGGSTRRAGSSRTR